MKKITSKKLIMWSSLIMGIYIIIVPIVAGYLLPSKPYGFEADTFSFLVYWFWIGVGLFAVLVLFNLGFWIYKKHTA